MGELSAAEIGASYDCKQHGCTNPARSRVGRYSYCDEHRERRAAEKSDGPSNGRASFADKVTELQRAAREADRAEQKARKLTATALAAKREAEAAAEKFRELARTVTA